MERGTLGFDLTASGDLADRAKNVELLRKLWLDRSMISGEELGDGDPGDFDHGAWHIACHLVAAAGVFHDRNGRLLWAEISHRRVSDDYCATVWFEANGSVESWPLASAEGQTVLQGATVLGFVEGNIPNSL